VVLSADLRQRGILQPEGGEGGGRDATGGLERVASRPESTHASRDVVKPFLVHG
jgi:hypothetical protein